MIKLVSMEQIYSKSSLKANFQLLIVTKLLQENGEMWTPSIMNNGLGW